MRGAGATTITQRWAFSRSGVVRHSANALVAGEFAVGPAGAPVLVGVGGQGWVGEGGVEGRECETERNKKRDDGEMVEAWSCDGRE